MATQPAALAVAGIRDAARRDWDVVVIGGGNAGLVAAITAAERGCRVLLLEAAGRDLRAGNTRHTRNIRCAHNSPDPYAPGKYSVDELLGDLRSVGGSPTNPALAVLTVSESESVVPWMEARGVRWQAPLRGTVGLARTNRFFLGGGKALANRYYRVAEDASVTVLYEARVANFDFDGRRCHPIVAGVREEEIRIRTRATVVASGGFEANLAWLKRYWGPAADNYIVRGTPHNDGSVLARLLDLGAATRGDPQGFHAIAVDARSPKFDGGIATRLDCIPFGIVVNRDAQRFADEGLDIWPKRYASWGGLIARQPDQIAYAIIDSQAMGKFIPPLYPPMRSDTISGLARTIGIDARTLNSTVSEFNAHVDRKSELNPGRLDGVMTVGLEPAKSNWACRLDQPPFLALPLRVGITFTYMGVAVNERAQVLDTAGNPMPNVFAAGEIMSGNVLTSGYLAGFGLTIGSVFGRIAGREASRVAA
jgi:tricarballylate dehydrogenase